MKKIFINGPNGSAKGLVADLFVQKGYELHKINECCQFQPNNVGAMYRNYMKKIAAILNIKNNDKYVFDRCALSYIVGYLVELLINKKELPDNKVAIKLIKNLYSIEEQLIFIFLDVQYSDFIVRMKSREEKHPQKLSERDVYLMKNKDMFEQERMQYDQLYSLMQPLSTSWRFLKYNTGIPKEELKNKVIGDFKEIFE